MLWDFVVSNFEAIAMNHFTKPGGVAETTWPCRPFWLKGKRCAILLVSCDYRDFNSESSNHAMSSSNLSGGLQFYPRLGSKASSKQSNEYGDCCNAITVTLAMSLPSNSRQDARPP